MARLAVSRLGLTISPRAGRNRRLPKESPMQKSKARRKAAKVRRKRIQNTHFKTRCESSKTRYK